MTPQFVTVDTKDGNADAYCHLRSRARPWLALHITLSALVPQTFILPPEIHKIGEGFRQLQPSEHVQWFSLDFLDSDQIATTGESILAAAPHIDRIIVTAGVLHDGEIQPEKRVGALEAEVMLHLYQINAMGPVLFLNPYGLHCAALT